MNADTAPPVSRLSALARSRADPEPGFRRSGDGGGTVLTSRVFLSGSRSALRLPLMSPAARPSAKGIPRLKVEPKAGLRYRVPASAGGHPAGVSELLVSISLLLPHRITKAKDSGGPCERGRGPHSTAAPALPPSRIREKAPASPDQPQATGGHSVCFTPTSSVLLPQRHPAGRAAPRAPATTSPVGGWGKVLSQKRPRKDSEAAAPGLRSPRRDK